MIRTRRPSPQMRRLIERLYANAPVAQHGYELMKETGLASGTLYPLLMRMTDQGLVEAEWHPPAQPGRPPRHAYRLTTTGLALARELTGQGPIGESAPA